MTDIDPRVEAVADFTDALEVAMPRWSGCSPEERIMLACGFHSGWHKREEADRAAGIVRVRVDDETVERVARGMYCAAGNRVEDWVHLPSEDPHKRLYMATAGAALAAIRGES